MNVSVDRATGAFFLIFGLAMYFLIIPAQVDLGEEGNLAPDTLPNAVAMVVAVCGLLLVLRPTDHEPQNTRYFIRTGLFVLILAVSIYAMSIFGFVYVAPLLALALMLMIGERRPGWLAAGVLGMPVFIWAFVTQILERALP
jgi:putative tricarboxylic transport membrane protein